MRESIPVQVSLHARRGEIRLDSLFRNGPKRSPNFVNISDRTLAFAVESAMWSVHRVTW